MIITKFVSLVGVTHSVSLSLLEIVVIYAGYTSTIILIRRICLSLILYEKPVCVHHFASLFYLLTNLSSCYLQKSMAEAEAKEQVIFLWIFSMLPYQWNEPASLNYDMICQSLLFSKLWLNVGSKSKLKQQKDKEPEEQKEDKPASPLILEVELHCSGCIKKIRRCVLKIRGPPLYGFHKITRY